MTGVFIHAVLGSLGRRVRRAGTARKGRRRERLVSRRLLLGRAAPRHDEAYEAQRFPGGVNVNVIQQNRCLPSAV